MCRRPTGAVRIVLRRQPGCDRLVVILGLQQALMERRPEPPLAPVELGREQELLEWDDRGRPRDDLLELRW